MEEGLLKLFSIISWPGAFALLIWVVLRPLTIFWLGKFNNKLNHTKNGTDLRFRDLEKSVNNEIQHDIERLEDEDKKLWAAVGNIQRDVGIIKETLLRRRN